MNILIIEDELLAQQKLTTMLLAQPEEYKVLATLASVKDAVHWLRHHPAPDLALVDIQLSDDHSFEIFRQFPVSFPVIFTTAYDKYVLESMEYNTIDYLLKPITEDKLRRALDKVRKLEHHFVQANILNLVRGFAVQSAPPRIVARKGAEHHALDIGDIAYFFTEHKVIFVRDHTGRQLMVDGTLGEIENRLSKKDFFRLNRKYLAHIKSIEKFRPEGGKIRIHLNPEAKEAIFVSKESAPHFRQWVSGL